MEHWLARLGRMCATMSRRWLRAWDRVGGYAQTPVTVDKLVTGGSISEGVTALVDLVAQITPRVQPAMRVRFGGHLREASRPAPQEGGANR